MAEPSLGYLKRISELFCAKYNEINNTHFSFYKIEDEPSEADFYVQDGEIIIPIQFSIVQSTHDFLKSAAQTAKVTQKIEEMGNIYRFNCIISVVFHKVPLTDAEIKKFVSGLMVFLSQHLSKNSFSLRYEKNSDLELLTGIFYYLSEFKILSIGNPQFGVIIGNESWGYARTIDEDVNHHLCQIRQKDSKYYPNNNLILLLDTDPMPITGITLEEIRKQCSLLKFNCKEIWQVNTGNQGFCEKIYPY